MTMLDRDGCRRIGELMIRWSVRLQHEGRIKLCKFPYDTAGTKKPHEIAQPSLAYPEDLNLPPEKIAFAPEEFNGSDKYDGRMQRRKQIRPNVHARSSA